MVYSPKILVHNDPSESLVVIAMLPHMELEQLYLTPCWMEVKDP